MVTSFKYIIPYGVGNVKAHGEGNYPCGEGKGPLTRVGKEIPKNYVGRARNEYIKGKVPNKLISKIYS